MNKYIDLILELNLWVEKNSEINVSEILLNLELND